MRPALIALTMAMLASDAAAQTNRPDGLYAEIHTVKGKIVAKLEPDMTPLAVANFVGLAEGTIENAAFDPGRPFYDGMVYSRVVPGHVIQGGAARGGRSTGPGYNFPNEIHAALRHDRAGALNFANGGPHTNASQWCIMLGDRSYLDGDYIVFGNVIEGLDVVMRIVLNDGVDSIRILRVGAKAQSYRPTTASFRAMMAAAQQRVVEHDAKKKTALEEWIRRNHPNATGPAGGVLTQRLREGNAAAPTGPLRVLYRGSEIRYLANMLGHTGPALEVTPFTSTENGTPNDAATPQTFTFEFGKTAINRTLDSVIAAMKPGERRVVIVPPELGYGRGGFYAPEVPGKVRFAISPYAMLVYELEVQQ